MFYREAIHMGTLSKATVARLAALYLVGSFAKGVYGLKRMHKVMYLAEREATGLRPFTYRRHLFGQYSDDLEDVKDQLIAMGYISPVPLDTAQPWRITLPDGRTVETLSGGNRYIAQASREAAALVGALETAAPALAAKIRESVKQFGYLSEQDLVDHCYSLPEFNSTEEGEVIFKADLDNRVEVPLDEDACDDMELMLSPNMLSALTTIESAMNTDAISWDEVEVVEIAVPARGA